MGASGRVGLTVVGQIAGSFFGPIGAAVGGALGSTLGAALWPEQIEGPRLEGLQVSSSSYGWPIPDIFGTVRTAGNMVWRYPLDSYYETANTEQQGKGGGPEVTTYSYALDFAILVCEGPIIGVRRVWADQRLIFDVSATETSTLADGTSGSLGVGLEQLIATVEGKASSMRVYLGDETQLPDPTIEAHVGVGNTPAYRGYAYIVFPNFNLSDFGNRIPNITVEVVKGGAAVGPLKRFEEAWSLPYESLLVDGIGYGQHVRIVSADGHLTVAHSRSGYYQKSFISELDATAPRSIASDTLAWPDQKTNPINHETLLLWDGATAIFSYELPPTHAFVATYPNVRTGVLVDAALRTYSITGDSHYAVLTDGGEYVHAFLPCADWRHVLAILQPAGDPSHVGYWILFRWDGGFVEIDRGTIAAGALSHIARSAGNLRAYAGGASVWAVGMLESDLRHAWSGYGNGGGADKCFLFEIGDDGVLREAASFSTKVGLPADNTCTIFADKWFCWFEVGGWLHCYQRVPTVPLGLPTLAAVVTSICEAAGLAAADIDVTDLAGVTVRGYMRPTRMAARAALEPLITAYAFDAVESDLKVKFRLRDAAVDVTIPADDLGAGADGAATAAVESQRMQESELPQSIDLSYMDADADYQVGTQLAQRLAVTSDDVQSVHLALALQAWQATAIVNRMLFETWVARSSRKFETTLKYAKYEPTDVMTVEAPDGARYTVRAIDKREHGQMIEWTGVDVDAAGFAPAGAVATAPGGATMAALPGPTEFFAADLPPLREADFGTFGYYTAGNGIGSATWPGAGVYSSVDGVAYSLAAQLTTGAAIGVAPDALGRWGYTSGADAIFAGFTVDFTNSVEVVLPSTATLSSCTFDELLALTNVALLGSEILAFQQATFVSTGIYRLSGFLRGLQGTENVAASATGHVAGERFVLLSDVTVRRVTDLYADVFQDLQVKGVTVGRTVDGAAAQALPRTGASAVPPAPTHTVGRQSGSDLVVSFTRRSYVDGTWDSGRDVPALSTEEYAVDVNLTGGARKTFIRSGPAPHTITAAELATIGGTVSGVSFYVAQVPPATPASTALIGTPTTRPNFWSRRNTVTWV